jgi:23S rRNA (adenine2503-C2)-methyltransferase
MPIAGRLCVSSQVGCTLNCRFCHTGTMRLVRNLTAGEIVGQVMLARDALGEWPSQPEGRMLTNIVMMGMGEPLYNFDNVRDALKLVMDGDGLALSQAPHHALHLGRGADDGARGRGDRRQPRGLAPCRDQGSPRRDRADQPQIRHRGTAPGLRRLSRRQQCAPHHVRICDAEGQERQRRRRARAGPADPQIQAARQGQSDPVQSLAGRALRMFDAERIRRFSNIVFEGGISAPVRTPRGRDIDAACGQLKTRPKRRAGRSRSRGAPLEAQRRASLRSVGAALRSLPRQRPPI